MPLIYNPISKNTFVFFLNIFCKLLIQMVHLGIRKLKVLKNENIPKKL